MIYLLEYEGHDGKVRVHIDLNRVVAVSEPKFERSPSRYEFRVFVQLLDHPLVFCVLEYDAELIPDFKYQCDKFTTMWKAVTESNQTKLQRNDECPSSRA